VPQPREPNKLAFIVGTAPRARVVACAGHFSFPGAGVAMPRKPKKRPEFVFKLPNAPLIKQINQSSKTIDVDGAARYLERYIAEYRKAHEQFTSPAPVGPGYPDLRISPYLYTSRLNCAIADDGFVIWDSWDQLAPRSNSLAHVPHVRR
jgi:hypothetical protein